MGYLSCNAESAVATCDSYNFELLSKNPRNKNQRRRSDDKPSKITEFEFEDLSTATGGFAPNNLLGKGSHGHVYRAHFHQTKLVAAVKRLKKQSNSTADNEVEILSRIRHPRLVNLLGFCSDRDRRKLIVVEYMPYGSLHDSIHSPAAKPLGWAKRARYALQIAKAVHFLHSHDPPVIHRDIKSTNVLIDSSRSCRLSDFGLALMGHVEDAKLRCTPPAGTLGYLDPSYLAPDDLSSKSDVFSFGILLLELITGRKAIDMNHSPPSVVDWAAPAIKSGDVGKILDTRLRPPEDGAAVRRLAATAFRCVRPSAARRPSMEEVVECLKIACKEMKTARTAAAKLCVGLVGPCANEEACLVKYEVLDEGSGELAAVRGGGGSKKNARVSSSSSSGGASVGRSKSIGTASEIKYQPLDPSLDYLSRRMRVGMKISTVRLGKSRSTGIMQSRRLTNYSANLVVDRTRLEESKLLADVIGENVKGEVTQ